MVATLSDALSAAKEIHELHFTTAQSVLLAGSFVRGEATETSDLDLVVLHDHVQPAWRQSLTVSGWPVEAFVHDLATLAYFFWDVDRPTGVPSLTNMVIEGIEIPGETELGRKAKDLAQKVLAAGPEPWDQENRDNSRYGISDMVEDIRAPRSSGELRLVLANLHTALANHFCRSQNLWSAKGKGIPRRLAKIDPDIARQFTKAFDAAFEQNDTAHVIQLAEHILKPDGGFLFDGYRRDAPEGYRRAEP